MKIVYSLSNEKYNKVANLVSGENKGIVEVLKEIDHIDLLIVDSSMDSIDMVLENVKSNRVKVVIWGVGMEASKLRDYFKKDLVYDYIDDNTYINLVGICKKVEEERGEVINISDSSQEIFISIKKLNYITYDRVSRKTLLNYGDKCVMLTKKLSDLELSLSSFANFKRADRSTIVNTNLIESINYKDESISFVGGDMVNLSKTKLKELRESVAMAN